MRQRLRVGTAVVAFALVAGVSGCTSGHPAAAPSSAPSGPVAVGPAPSGSLPAAPSGGYSPGAATSGDSLFPKRGNGGYDATHYAVTIGYDPAAKHLSGHAVVTATATQNLSAFDLDLHGLTVSAVTVDGAVAAWTLAGDKLLVTPAHGIVTGATFSTDVRYAGQPTPYQDPQLGFEGFIPEANGALAQGEPDVAASWFPVDDRPGDKATYDVTVSAPSALAALSNGVLVDKVSSGATTAWHWREDQPMASYLAMVVIGDYRVITGTHDGLPVITAVSADLPTSIDATLAQTPQVVDFLSTVFGPYPFDAMGGIVHNDPRIRFALENQSRPVYSPVFFHPGEDDRWVLAHELAHQWFGDSVSVADWRDIWLNEGFATYAEWLWGEHIGAGRTPLGSFTALYNGAWPADPPADPDLGSVFGTAVYQRGAATLEALRITVGDADFFRIVKGWAALHAGGNATTAQFIAYVDTVTGKKLDPMLNAWLYKPGKPPYPKPMS